MKILGWFIAAGGVVYMLIAFNMDVSVSSYSPYGGGEIANLDLMARRQNHLIVAALITMIGVLLGLFGPSSAEPTPQAGQAVSGTRPQPFSGSRDLNEDPYRLWLAGSYAIARNDVFDRFIVGDRTFATLDEALAHAHEQELENERGVIAAKEQREAEWQAYRERQAAQREADDARWEEFKPKLFVGIGMALFVMVGAYFVLRESPEEREARLAKAAVEKAALVAMAKEEFDVALPDDATDVSNNPVSSESEIWCDGETAGNVLRFTTQSDSDAIVSLFSKTLGDGEAGVNPLDAAAIVDAAADAELMQDEPFNGVHKWRKKRVDYILNVAATTNGNAVYLCRPD